MREAISLLIIPVVLLWLSTAAAVAATPDGAALYKEHCAVCHGDRGDAMTRARRGLNPPPRDFTTPVARAELDRARMLASVSKGRPGTAMMAFEPRLSSEEIAAVVDYIRDNFMIKEDVTVDAAMLRRSQGQQLYVSNCAVCHGDDGNGAMWTISSLNPPPRDFTTAQAMSELTRERMLTSVTHGRPGTAMMSFSDRLTADEIEIVVDYVRGTFLGKAMTANRAPSHSPHAGAAMPPPAAAVPVDMNAAMPSGLVGDPSKGEVFYQSNCFTCHGKNGDGQGPRAQFNRPAPRNFLDPRSRESLNRPALFSAITKGKTGTVMPAWGKVLEPQQIADVAEYVFQAFISADASKKKAN